MVKVDKDHARLKKLAQDIFTGNVFTSDHARPNAVSLDNIFLPLALMSESLILQIRNQDVVLLYEYFNQACPRAINGHPTFRSFNTLTRDEYKIMHGYYTKIKEAMEAI